MAVCSQNPRLILTNDLAMVHCACTRYVVRVTVPMPVPTRAKEPLIETLPFEQRIRRRAYERHAFHYPGCAAGKVLVTHAPPGRTSVRLKRCLLRIKLQNSNDLDLTELI
jgi:hypothetical protein